MENDPRHPLDYATPPPPPPRRYKHNLLYLILATLVISLAVAFAAALFLIPMGGSGH